MGPVVSAQQHERVMAYIEGAQADPNCELLTGGRRPPAAAGKPGFFVEPTIFEVTGEVALVTDVTHTHTHTHTHTLLRTYVCVLCVLCVLCACERVSE